MFYTFMQAYFTKIMLKFQIFNILIFCLMMASCSKQTTNGSQAGPETSEMTKPGPHLIIYKTNSDYYSNVPVTLSPDKSIILNYPGTKDVYYKGELAYPVRLSGGFLLDHRGIGIHSAFTGFTYEEYSRLEKTPSPEELLKAVIDKEPITEMYDCGSINRFKEPVEELNKLIEIKDFSSFTKIK